MTRIKVEIDRKDPPVERIRRYKNYKKFVSEYHRFHSQHGLSELWYRDKKRLAYVAIIIALILLWLFGSYK